jgi:NAD(P)-dependent dehydrogenase (short-subunit alcohol dehydrogenase family)
MHSFPDVFSLTGKTALITGGGTGIGLAIAKSMYAAGATVILVGRRVTELELAVKELGPRSFYFSHDITEFDKSENLIKRITEAHGPIDCLVNNAGINLKKPAIDTSVEEFQTILSTNVLAAHVLTKAVAPQMIERKSGSILFIASMASLFGIPMVVAYSAAKSAQVGMVRTLASELSSQGIRVNAIAPGWIETAMSAKAFAGDPERLKKVLGRTPMAKLGKPEDIGWTAVYLASQAASFVTGVVIPVDGGVSIGF